MEAAVRTTALSKDYGRGRGLHGLDLQVAAQEVFGYLGPNGAGKTTTIRCLMGMIRPTGGSARIFGIDCVKRPVEVKRMVGYLPGELAQYGGLTGAEVVAHMASLRGGVDASVVRGLTERFDLDLSVRYIEYSRGNKQKLGVVIAFMHRPDLLILDEPTAGLDPLNQHEFYALIRESRERGATVFLSSHVLSEVEHVCDRVGIIRSGRLVRVAELEELHDIRLHKVEVTLTGTVPIEAVRNAAGVDNVSVIDHTLTCTVKGDFDALLQVIGDIGVAKLVSNEPSLEETFLAYYSDP